jgi:hypothetical protein
MVSMTSRFPALETCVILCHFEHYNMTSEQAYLTRHSLATNMLGVRHRFTPQSPDMFTLRETLLAFIKTFIKQGPGKRKFIRFHHALPEGGYDIWTGPLILVARRPARVLERACRGPPTRSPKTHRPRKVQVATLQDHGSLSFVAKSS